MELEGLGIPADLTIFAKAEFLNPGGSVKSRTARALIRDAERNGRLRPGDTIVEATSGNEGIALAMIAAWRGYRVHIVMPEDVPQERRQIIQAYGGEVELVASGQSIRDTIEACRKRAEDVGSRPGFYYSRQFESQANVDEHAATTAHEVMAQIEGPIDAFVAAVGTGGTLTGMARSLKKRYPKVLIVAVEPESSQALSGGPIGQHAQYGMGEGFVPEILDRSLIDRVVATTDEEAFAWAGKLARAGLLVGVSSGSNVAAAVAMGSELDREARIVTLLPDSGERYLSDPTFQKALGQFT